MRSPLQALSQWRGLWADTTWTTQRQGHPSLKPKDLESTREPLAKPGP